MGNGEAKYQIIWWGGWRGINFRKADDNWRPIYRWFLNIGPLEIRRWARPA